MEIYDGSDVTMGSLREIELVDWCVNVAQSHGPFMELRAGAGAGVLFQLHMVQSLFPCLATLNLMRSGSARVH